MSSDKRGLLAIVASVVIFIIWYSFLVPKFWPEEKKVEMTKEESTTPQEKATTTVVKEEKEGAKKAVAGYADVEEVTSIIENDFFKATFTNYGARPTAWTLKKYTTQKEETKEPINLIPKENLPEMPLQLSFEKQDVPVNSGYRLIEEGKGLLKYRWSSKNIVVEKIYTLGENDYDLNFQVIVTNKTKNPINERLSVGWTAPIQTKEKKGGFLSFLKRPSDIKVPVYMLNGEVERKRNTAKIKEEQVEKGRLYWSGIEDRYFLSAILPRSESQDMGAELGKFGSVDDAGFYSGVVLPRATIVPSGSEEYNFIVYAGPKEMHLLKEVGMSLEKAIDYGWFTVIAIPILYVLKFLHSIVHNYGIAIILLTILIKILLHPISKKSMKSMKGMKQLQPRLKELKEKYGSDKQRLNTEMMQLFKAHKVNPMSGCLPMVLQLPVYIALYRVLWNSIELYQAPFFWFYTDLSQPDPYFITPVLLGVAMFLQQKMTPTASADPAQQKMMMMMPLMFTVFLAFLPVGLVIYILVNTVVTVIQQWMNNNDIRFRDLVRGKIPKRAKA